MNLRLELLATFDTALMNGCMVVVSCIQSEIQSIQVEESGRDLLRFGQRMQAMWNDTNIKELVDQLRGQQSALSLLVQLIQMYNAPNRHLDVSSDTL
jgi:hypothetical protein